jgi:hypothetical protein
MRLPWQPAVVLFDLTDSVVAANAPASAIGVVAAGGAIRRHCNETDGQAGRYRAQKLVIGDCIVARLVDGAEVVTCPSGPVIGLSGGAPIEASESRSAGNAVMRTRDTATTIAKPISATAIATATQAAIAPPR